MSNPTAEPRQLDLAGIAPPADAPYRVRRSPRARCLQIAVSPLHGVEVIVPRRHSARRVASFVSRHRGWIAEAWAELMAAYPGAAGPLVPAAIELRALDERWEVSTTLGTDHAALSAAQGRLAVCAPDHESACRALRAWAMRRAQATLPGRLSAEARASGLSYRRVQVRGQRTLWGSCSTRGSISLNWKLLFLPPDLVRYLLLHELAHTRHFRHSRAFWALVGVFEPRARELDAQLDDAWRHVPRWTEA
jgi:hypothetical protein